MSHSINGYDPSERSPRNGRRSVVRRSARRNGSLGLGAALVAALALSSGVAAAAPPRIVTLVTGDRVVVSGEDRQSIVIQRGPGRDQIPVSVHRYAPPDGRQPHWFALPHDALPLIASGRVDKRLFDISLLLQCRYDDASRGDLPLIASGSMAPSSQSAAPSAMLPGAVVHRRLDVLGGVALRSSKERLGELWRQVVGRASPSSVARSSAPGRLWLDAVLAPNLDRSTAQVSAPAAWDLGLFGDGVRVAVLDTGVDSNHPDLASRVTVERNFTEDPLEDGYGHGTHVASILAGTGEASGGRYRGMAPGAQLLAGKVCDDFGNCEESAIIAAAEWAIVEEGARVVNLSLGGPDTPEIDPLEEAINRLTEDHGALFVVSAGNFGPFAGSVESPSSADAALAVGAVDREDAPGIFSARGPRVGDFGLKPDITAPGVEIVAALSGFADLGEPVDEAYIALSGTSMAAPHVAGAAALLLQQHPDWRAREVKAALMGSATWSPTYTALDQGAGRLDVAGAVQTEIIADTAGVSFGIARWPHEDDEVVAREVTLRSLGPAATLELHLEVSGPEGEPAPDEMFHVEPAIVELAAGGSASATVTVDPRQGSVDGAYSARLIASSGAGRSTSVPLALYREPESYDLTLRHTDRSGERTVNYFSLVIGRDDFFYQFVSPSNESDSRDQTLRLTKGHYVIETHFFVDESEPATLLAAPDVSLEKDTLLELDARVAPPMSLRVKHVQGAERNSTSVSWDGPGLSSTTALATTEPAYYAAFLGDPGPEVTSMVSASWQESVAREQPQAFYIGAWPQQGGFPQGPELTVEPRRAARLKATYAASSPPLAFAHIGIAPLPEGATSWGYSAPEVTLPVKRTEYLYSEAPGMRWIHDLSMEGENFFDEYAFVDTEPQLLPLESESRLVMNQAPFSPGFLDGVVYLPGARRQGDTIGLSPFMYTDSGGNTRQSVNFTAYEESFALYREGERVEPLFEFGTSGDYEVPPGRARYRAVAESRQTEMSVATESHAAWTFESESAPEDEMVILPLLSVRFQPELSDGNRAPAGQAFSLPFVVEQLGEPRPPRLSSLELEASYDDGVSWTALPTRGRHGSYVAELRHPRHAEFVSLRARAEDHHHSGLELTLIRAYALTAKETRRRHD